MKLFVYGTLKYKQNLAAVLGRDKNLPEHIPAVLHDYFKHGLNIVPMVGSDVEGFVLDITEPNDWKRLDRYEGIDENLYKRITVDVEVNGETVECTAYQLDLIYDL